MGNLKNKIRFSILLISIVFISIVTPNITYFNTDTSIQEENDNDDKINNFSETMKDSNGVIISITYDPEILIDGDNNGNNWTWAVAQSWCSGSGTWGDPYIIDNLDIIDSDGLGGCLEIRDSKAYFIIQNCEFMNSTSEEGVYLRNVANGTIGVNNEFSDNRYGIYLRESKNCTIQGNTIKNCYTGIYYRDNSHNQSIINNNLNECDFGVYVNNGIYNITATGNSFSSCGIYLNDDYYKMVLSHSFDTSNTVNGRTLYYYKSIESFDAGDFNNAGQIILANCSNAIISNVNASYASQGISLYESDDNIVLNSNATHNEKNGIYCYRSENVTLSLNIASNNSVNGIYIRDNCQEINVTDNEVNYNENYGINLYDTVNSNITFNKIMYNEYAGIYLQSTENITLINNEIITGGVKIDGSTNEDFDSHKIDTSNTVNGDVLYYYSKEKDLDVSKFSNAGQVILISCNDSTILNQNVSQVTRGFVVRWCKNITINRCNSSSTDNAFRILYSNWINISNSIANNNSYNGIYITECSNNIINGNEMKFNYYGLILDYSNDSTISDNVIENNSDTGISIWEGFNNTVINNTLRNNQEYGIFLDQGNIHNITGNSMFECGIYINDYNTIESMINNSIDDTNEVNGKPVYYYVHEKGLNANNFTNAGQLILINCSYAIISNLNVTHGTVGLTIYHSDNNTISRINASFNSQYGVLIGYSNGNNITESLFQGNGDTGLAILDTTISRDNMIYTNAFIENGVAINMDGDIITNNAYGGSNLNKWDNGTIGNYWDDYDGADKNDNGIGDTPYLVTSYGSIFPINVYDNFPIWDDGLEVSSSSSSSSDDDDEVPPLEIPLGNYYIAFIIIPTLALVFYYKKRKL